MLDQDRTKGETLKQKINSLDRARVMKQVLPLNEPHCLLIVFQSVKLMGLCSLPYPGDQ
jgi:hypothetical protein